MSPSKSPAKSPTFDLILLDDEDVDGNIISSHQTILKKVKSSHVGIQVLSPNLKLTRMSAGPGLTKSTWKYSLRGQLGNHIQKFTINNLACDRPIGVLMFVLR